MIFRPRHIESAPGQFVFGSEVLAHAPARFREEVFAGFWQGFTFGTSALRVEETEELIFSVGQAQPPELCGHAYALHICETGVCVRADNLSNLLLGFMTLLDRIVPVEIDGQLRAAADCCLIHDTPLLHERMVHFCVFPETQLWELERFVRMTAALKYSHIILEFWGMLRYDCMPELAWPFAFTKDEVRPIIAQARALGLEVVPMFNHWGHAAASRAMHGKHVVLDQNPALQLYFSEDGWCWDIRKERVRTLLRSIRQELIALCGPGAYFHIGCDEAYNFALTQENMDFILDFIHEVNRDLQSLGRRAVIWGDMLLYRHAHYQNRYSCNASTPEAEEYLLSHLSRDVIIADWQYHALKAPVETALLFAKEGFDCFLCPWDEGKAQLDACMDTLRAHPLRGVIHTTWHTLTKGMPYVTLAAVACFEEGNGYALRQARVHTAALLRKISPACGQYDRAGWARSQIGIIT